MQTEGGCVLKHGFERVNQLLIGYDLPGADNGRLKRLGPGPIADHVENMHGGGS